MGFDILLNAGYSGLESLIQLCNLLPSDKAALCVDFCTKEVGAIEMWLKHDYSSDFICTIIGVCDSVVDPASVRICHLCEEGFKLIEDTLSFDPTEEEIETLLEFVCRLLPEGPYRDACDMFITKNISFIISSLVGRYPPKLICEEIGAC